MMDFSGLFGGLAAYFADGTALGALATFLVANLPLIGVTVSAVKRWVLGAKHGIGVVQSDVARLRDLYTTELAALRTELASAQKETDKVLAVLSVAFTNSRLDPAVRAEIAKLTAGADASATLVAEPAVEMPPDPALAEFALLAD